MFEKTLDPYQDISTMMGMKGKRHPVKVSHVTSTINQNENLNVDVPNMSQNDVILPGSLCPLFDLDLTGTNTKRTIVNNKVKSIVQKLRITWNGSEVQSINNYHVLAVYRDL